MSRTVAVVGAGWAGLAAAVEATQAGADVTLFEMAPQAGGRARSVGELDNGQHICIGAYGEVLRLMRAVGVAEVEAFVRMPLTLVDSDGFGLRLGGGAPMPAFALAVLRRRGWRWSERVALLRLAARWSRQGFACAIGATVDDLCAGLPERVRRDFIDPLCVAGLNTPASEASGSVFLRVLHDALASGPGSADLLLPRLGLSELLATPATRWLSSRGAALRPAHRVERIERDETGWRVDGASFDRVVLAASAVESARLAAAHSPTWAGTATALRYEPIVTVYARSAGCRLPEAMLALAASAVAPAQFVFDRGRLGGADGLLAFVVSGAAEWVARGSEIVEAAALAQARQALAPYLAGPLEVVRTIVEKRATFACTPGLVRPPGRVVEGLFAAGDYVDGPYPATLEGAVRSGVAAAVAALA